MLDPEIIFFIISLLGAIIFSYPFLSFYKYKKELTHIVFQLLGTKGSSALEKALDQIPMSQIREIVKYKAIVEASMGASRILKRLEGVDYRIIWLISETGRIEVVIKYHKDRESRVIVPPGEDFRIFNDI